METIFLKEGDKIKSYFAFFDLDHTLISAVSGKELAIGAYKRGLMKTPDIIRAILLSLSYKIGIINPAKAIDRMGSWVKGISTADLEKLCLEVSEEVLIPAVYRQAEAEIKIHRENNAGLIILSSTLSPVGKRMSEHFDFDDIICSGLEENNGILTGFPDGSFCFGEEKALRLKKYCERNNTNPGDAWYYGDSLSDLPALSIVGHPVCINPGRKLAGIARKNGWDTYNWE